MAKNLSVKAILNRIEKNIKANEAEEAAYAAEEERVKKEVGDIFNKNIDALTKFTEKNKDHDFSGPEIEALSDAIIYEARSCASEEYPEVVDTVIASSASSIVRDREINSDNDDNDYVDNVAEVFSYIANTVDY